MTTKAEVAARLAAAVEDLELVAAEPAACYRTFTFPKASGGVREIRAPQEPLRTWQRALLDDLYDRVAIPAHLHGGLPRRSIRTHASPHVRRRMVATLDLRGFFDAIGVIRVRPVLHALGFHGAALELVVALVLLDGSLPQGAPTSSLLANLAFLPADGRILRLCRRRELTYTRFVDDMALSGDRDFRDLRGPVDEIVQQLGHELHPGKIRFQGREAPQVVTGLVVNDRLRPTRAFRVAVDQDLALAIRHPQLLVARLGLGSAQAEASLRGRISFLRQFDAPAAERLEVRLRQVDWRERRPHARDRSACGAVGAMSPRPRPDPAAAAP